jgi:hypothetical protein
MNFKKKPKKANKVIIFAVELIPAIMKSNDEINVDKVIFVARIFAIPTHPERTEITNLLLENPGLNVSQIYAALNIKKTIVTEHLKLMKNYGILQRRKGFIYSVNTELLQEIIQYSEELCKRE